MRTLTLTLAAATLLPSAARAACSEADYPDLDDRLSCFDTFLTLIDGNMTSMASGQATIGGLISTQATRLNNIETEVDANTDAIATIDLSGVDANAASIAAIEADYLTSADLSGLASESYVDSAVAGSSGGIEGLSDYLRVDSATDSVFFEGANVYVQSGSGYTDDDSSGNYTDGEGSLTGLGNLIIGYAHDEYGAYARTGSHNLVVGDENDWTGFGGIVAGWFNAIGGDYASAVGGTSNAAPGHYAAVAGGYDNTASGPYATVSGGRANEASDDYAAVFGGRDNTASAQYTTLAGGQSLNETDTYGAGPIDDVLADYLTGADLAGLASEAYVDDSLAGVAYLTDLDPLWGAIDSNTQRIDQVEVDVLSVLADYLTSADLSGLATEVYVDDAVAGVDLSGYATEAYVDDAVTGVDLSGYATESYVASGLYAAVSGGSHNTASGEAASAGGGVLGVASGYGASLVGGETNTASGDYASITGGWDNTASGSYGAVHGGQDNEVSYTGGAILGGQYNEASGYQATVSGGWDNRADGGHASVSGGASGRANGDESSVYGGRYQTASGNNDYEP